MSTDRFTWWVQTVTHSSGDALSTRYTIRLLYQGTQVSDDFVHEVPVAWYEPHTLQRLQTWLVTNNQLPELEESCTREATLPLWLGTRALIDAVVSQELPGIRQHWALTPEQRFFYLAAKGSRTFVRCGWCLEGLAQEAREEFNSRLANEAIGWLRSLEVVTWEHVLAAVEFGQPVHRYAQDRFLKG